MNLIAANFRGRPTPLTEISLCGWIGQAAPGDILEYHRGFLVVDVAPQGERLAPEERGELIRVAQRAWWASEKGLVHLVQRRSGSEEFRYLAIARPKPGKQSPSVSQLMIEEVA
jgi:hypothetical protein